MAEKLVRARCSVPGHGDRCTVAHEVRRKSAGRLSRLRRRAGQQEARNGWEPSS